MGGSSNQFRRLNGKTLGDVPKENCGMVQVASAVHGDRYGKQKNSMSVDFLFPELVEDVINAPKWTAQSDEAYTRFLMKKWPMYWEQKGVCKGCFYDFPIHGLEIDHIVPRKPLRDDGEHNLQLLCHACNLAKGKRTMEEALAAGAFDKYRGGRRGCEIDAEKVRMYREQKSSCNGCWHGFPIHGLLKSRIIPLKRGGADKYDNLQLLCHDCCCVKKNRTMEETLVDSGFDRYKKFRSPWKNICIETPLFSC